MMSWRRRNLPSIMKLISMWRSTFWYYVVVVMSCLADIHLAEILKLISGGDLKTYFNCV